MESCPGFDTRNLLFSLMSVTYLLLLVCPHVKTHRIVQSDPKVGAGARDASKLAGARKKSALVTRGSNKRKTVGRTNDVTHAFTLSLIENNKRGCDEGQQDTVVH